MSDTCPLVNNCIFSFTDLQLQVGRVADCASGAEVAGHCVADVFHADLHVSWMVVSTFVAC